MISPAIRSFAQRVLPRPVFRAGQLVLHPCLFIDGLAEQWTQSRRFRARYARLRGTCAAGLNRHQIETLELIEKAAAGGARVFYDIGANVGTWTALCRALVPGSTIIAFEPMQEHVTQFQSRTAGWPAVTLFPIALGRCVESREFHPTTFSDASSFLPLTATGRSTWNIQNQTTRMMTIVPLDDLIAREALPPPDLLKLDVQGFELEVLRGAEKALQSAKWVLSEVSFESYYDQQALFAEIAGYLAAHGFEVCAFGQFFIPGVPVGQTDVLFRRRSPATEPAQ